MKRPIHLVSENNENGNNGFYAEDIECSFGSCTWPEIGGAPPGSCDYLVPVVENEIVHWFCDKIPCLSGCDE